MAKDKQKVEATVSVQPPTKKFLHLRKPKRWLLGVLIAIVVAAVIFGTIEYFYNRSKNTVANNQCSTKAEQPLLQQAGSELYSVKVSKLGQTINKIQKIPNYQNDQNCLYPIVVYYINTGDSQNANKYLQELKKVYDSKKGFSTYFAPVKSISDLQNIIKLQNEAVKNASKNAKTFTVYHP